jgi:hypothetical protein
MLDQYLNKAHTDIYHLTNFFYDHVIEVVIQSTAKKCLLS